MPTTASSFGRFSYTSSSYPSYRTSNYSSLSNRTTSLERSLYSSSTPSYSTGSSYYSSRLSTLPPKSPYSSSIDTYRSSRTRVSPARTYGSRLSSDSSSYDKDSTSSSRYLTSRYRDSSDSGYSSRLTSRDRSYDNESGSYRRSSFSKSNAETSAEEDRIRVSDRIRVFEDKKDPAEERLALRRQRLGLTPQRDNKSKSPKVNAYEDNRKGRAEENGNHQGESAILDLCKKYDANLNLINGIDSGLSGCSGGAASAVSKTFLSDDLDTDILETKRDKSPDSVSKSKSGYRSKSPLSNDSHYTSKVSR